MAGGAGQEKQVRSLAALQRIHGRDQRWGARRRGSLQGERGRDDGDRRARAFHRDAARYCDPRDWRRRFRLSRRQTAPAWDPRGSRVSRRGSGKHVEISGEQRDRSGPAVSDVRDQTSSGCARAGITATAAAAATAETPASVSSRCYIATSSRRLRPMGHSQGRDNAKKRARRRKKTERLALAKKAKPAK